MAGEDKRDAFCNNPAMRRPRKRRFKRLSWPRRIALGLFAIPLIYLAAVLVGGLLSVNRGWTEPTSGTTVYLASNGMHVDLLMPVASGGLDWRRLIDPVDASAAPIAPAFVAFGMGDRDVYLNTPTWADLTPRTALGALTGGSRVMHVEWIADSAYATRQIRLTPEQYRRLWSSIAAGFERDKDGKVILLSHPGYGGQDRFYAGVGRASAIDTCNQWIAGRLRLAGVTAPLWSPFTWALSRRYRAL